MKLKILMVSFSRGRPFIEDTADELVKRDFIVWHLILSTLTFIDFNNRKKIELAKSTSFYLINYILGFRKILKLALDAKFDIVHFHPVYWLYTFLTPLIDKHKIKVIATIWGTDFYGASKRKRWIQSFFYKWVNNLTFTNVNTEIAFLKSYPHLKDKTQTLRFGLTKLDLIERIKKLESIDGMKKKLRVPINKRVICIGYNASKNQNHLKILKNIKRGQKSLPSNLILLLPISYGGNKEYINEIKEELSNIEIPHVLIEEFISDEDVCRLRLISEVFIQLQTSDQFSGAMQEALFAGSKVITGSWLPYDLLIKQGIQISLINDFSEIVETIQRNIFEEKVNKEHNSNIIYSLSGMSQVMSSWNKYYNSTVI